MVDSVQLRLGTSITRGVCQMIIRVRLEDRRDITRAARLLGLTQAQFTRNVLVQTARTVIAEAKSEEAA
jgi:uncharacterized protein (DUF1778 family)